MPPFFSYYLTPGLGGNVPLINMEADGKQLEIDHRSVVPIAIPFLGLPSTAQFLSIARGEAERGLVEFLPVDDIDCHIHWQIIGQMVWIRVQETILVVDFTHISSPSCPQHCRPTDFEPVE